MSAKLIVQKYESGIHYKSLYLTIDDNVYDQGSETKFSGWFNEKIQHKKKPSERSSRLVVKIVTGNEQSQFDFDSCARELSQVNNFSFPESNPIHTTKDASPYNRVESTNDNDYYGHQHSKDNFEINSMNYAKGANNVRTNNKDISDSISNALNKQTVSNSEETILGPNRFNTNDSTISPLEYSLERVKENNARIMENIQMLNRTLNYTKKKESLETSPKSMRAFPCTICGKCFVYETGLKRHYAMRHAMAELHPRWQTVWTCVECFQVWPHHDSAHKHASQCCKNDNVDRVREIKTSSLLQCEFCEKVYTSIPRLLKHSKLHTAVNNYECSPCDVAFMSYKAAEQHWFACPWLKVCYTFYLPKLLLCNSCDRKFRNYEQLYNHRYKLGHYTTKSHVLQNCMTPVYQCEHCAYVYPTITPLLQHKTEHHTSFDVGAHFQVVSQDSNFMRVDVDAAN